MLCTRMDMDLTSTEDGFLFKEHLNGHLFKNRKEQGQGLENESKDLDEKTEINTDEELSRSVGPPADQTNVGVQPSATASNSAGSLSPSEKADKQEWHMTDESNFQIDVQGLNLVHSTEALTSTIEDYKCHTEKQEPNDTSEILCNSVDETSKMGMEAGDPDTYFNKNNFDHTKPNSSQSLNGEFDRIPVDCSSDLANHDDNDINHGNIVHDTEWKGDYHMVGVVPSENGLVVREQCVVHSPEKETPILPQRELFNLHNRSTETEPCARQDQLPPEAEERKSSSPSKQIPYPEMERERSTLESPAGRLNSRISISPERQPSSTLKKSPDTKSFSRQDEIPVGKSYQRAAQSHKHTPSPERHIAGKKRTSSHEKLSPSVRHKSSSGRTSRENAHHRDHSPKKHLSSSPRRRSFPQRRDKSASRSPVRRKDSSTNRTYYKGRSRSRFPNTRDHHRESSRRRHSPRRRSPPPNSHSRHRSPRRPWSPPPDRNTGVGRPGRNLFVAGFSYATTERDLEKKFSRFGHVRGVRIVRDKRSGESRGFGFVSLERDEEADAAIRAIDRTEWNGRIVLVEKSKTPAR